MAEGETRANRTARRLRRRRIRQVSGVAVLIASTLGAVLALSGGDPPPKKRAYVAPSTTTTTAPFGTFTFATTKVAELDVYEQPTPDAPKVTTLPAMTSYRSPTTLLVTSAVQPSAPVGWVPVTVPLHEPNNTPGWVRAEDVTTAPTPYLIRISLRLHTLTLFKDGEEVLSTPVIIGAPGSVTPTGRFSLTDPVNCNQESIPGYPVGSCSGAYGAFAIGTSALSEQLDSFQGTIPQIAIHGTNLPATELGKDLSNGCVRMPNEIILQIAQITPLVGTPVTITPW